jgi:ABC-2 type transport system ATP-binding protein
VNEPAIRIEALSKYFGPVIGVEDLSLDVPRGEVFGFLGANGAGKTTTIRILLDLLRPSRGRAAVLGLDCQRDGLKARRHIGYLPGDLPIYPDLSASGYLTFLQRVDGRAVTPGYLHGLLKRFDVSDVDLSRKLRDQSHGMKQKIGIIQALMTEPPLVILDEPTAGLDPFMVQAFREAIEALKRRGDTTVFLSSHVLTEVETTCDRVAIVRSGKIVNVTSLETLEQQSPRRVTITFTRPIADAVPALHGVVAHDITATTWSLDVVGPLGILVAALGQLPVQDIAVEPFSLERHVMRFYQS